MRPQPKHALPIITYDDAVTLHLNGEDIRVQHFPSGHTDGDSIVFFSKSHVVHMGDVFRDPLSIRRCRGGRQPERHGRCSGNRDRAGAADVKLIPGHGQLSSLDDLRAYLTMLKATREAVAHALKDGKTLDQMKKAKMLDPWKKYSGEFVSEDAFLETIYISLTGQKTGDPIKRN